MPTPNQDRRTGGDQVIVRIVLDRPPDRSVLEDVSSVLRGSDSVVLSPGLEIEVVLHDTTPEAVRNTVAPRMQSALGGRRLRNLQVNGEDVVREDF